MGGMSPFPKKDQCLSCEGLLVNAIVDQPQPTEQSSTHSPEPPASTKPGNNGMGKEDIKRAFLDNLFYVQGKFPALATQHDYYMALAHLLRDFLLHRWVSTASLYTTQKVRTVCYLSEIGRAHV